ncbi:hypothetical protein ACX0G7_11470 [Flavitalea antarctica]
MEKPKVTGIPADFSKCSNDGDPPEYRTVIERACSDLMMQRTAISTGLFFIFPKRLTLNSKLGVLAVILSIIASANLGSSGTQKVLVLVIRA